MSAPSPNGDPVVFASSPGSSAPDHRSDGPGKLLCHVAEGYYSLYGHDASDLVEGNQYVIACVNAADGSLAFVRTFTYHASAPAVSPATLARQASRLLPLLYPSPATAPPATSTQLVGVRTWLWIDPQDYRPLTATAEVPGLTVTATAKPVGVRWTFGDGAPALDCKGPGTPYDPGRPDASQSTSCAHGYTAAGTYTVTATILWRVTWTGSDGSAGTLGTLSRGVSFPVTVEARQAVITH